jgi:hypothetical protein
MAAMSRKHDLNYRGLKLDSLRKLLERAEARLIGMKNTRPRGSPLGIHWQRERIAAIMEEIKRRES